MSYLKINKKETKQLLYEVTSHIQSHNGLKVVDTFSDCENKNGIIRKNPECPLEENECVIGYTGPQKYFGVCEFSVHKKGDLEFFIIWDSRVNQPFDKSFHCVYKVEGWFGRYEFSDKETFYKHILSDFGFTYGDTIRIDNYLTTI
jgi:hypothetical protein